ncbi:MAG: 50S ribosomal protein L21e [Candidatus Aenigmatarchaeota archaeon]|nr:50S ribosomal protein L21e [Candidatus Aenigmarchaeota archaeon]
MVVKSHGPRRRTREKFRKSTRMTVNAFVREFKEGSRVAIDIESGSPRGQPFKRFQGLTGTVKGRRGRAYIIQITDCGKPKTIIANPEHLKAV